MLFHIKKRSLRSRFSVVQENISEPFCILKVVEEECACSCREPPSEIVCLLLDTGASPNPTGVYKTPLQLAVNEDHRIEVVMLLIAAGAEVNAAGSNEAVDIDMEHRSAMTPIWYDSTNLESYYDTSLLMAEKKITAFKVGTSGCETKAARLVLLQAPEWRGVS